MRNFWQIELLVLEAGENMMNPPPMLVTEQVTRSAMRNFWQIELPVGSPTRGAPFGERCDPATITLVTAIGSAAGGVAALGGLLGGSKGSAPAPMIGKPTVMPTPDDEAAKLAKRKSLASQAQRRGRASTILSDDNSGDLLGA